MARAKMYKAPAKQKPVHAELKRRFEAGTIGGFWFYDPKQTDDGAALFEVAPSADWSERVGFESFAELQAWVGPIVPPAVMVPDVDAVSLPSVGDVVTLPTDEHERNRQRVAVDAYRAHLANYLFAFMAGTAYRDRSATWQTAPEGPRDTYTWTVTAVSEKQVSLERVGTALTLSHAWATYIDAEPDTLITRVETVASYRRKLAPMVAVEAPKPKRAATGAAATQAELKRLRSEVESLTAELERHRSEAAVVAEASEVVDAVQHSGRSASYPNARFCGDCGQPLPMVDA